MKTYEICVKIRYTINDSKGAKQKYIMDVSLSVFIIWNVLIMLIYAIDKGKAKKRRWRISETTLILPAFFFGGIGAMLGMILFNHKTSKMKFRLLIPFAFWVNIALIYFLERIQGR